MDKDADSHYRLNYFENGIWNESHFLLFWKNRVKFEEINLKRALILICLWFLKRAVRWESNLLSVQ